MRSPFLAVTIAMMLAVSFTNSHSAYAGEGKSKWNPAGWMKGEKKGWKEGDVPPGLADKDVKKAEKEARKKARHAEKEARKNERKAKHEAHEKAEALKAAN